MNNNSEHLWTKAVTRAGLECTIHVDAHHNQVGQPFFTPEQQAKRDAAEAARAKPAAQGLALNVDMVGALLRGEVGTIGGIGLSSRAATDEAPGSQPNEGEAAAIAALLSGDYERSSLGE